MSLDITGVHLPFSSMLNGLDCMHEHNDMHVVESLACDQQHY